MGPDTPIEYSCDQRDGRSVEGKALERSRNTTYRGEPVARARSIAQRRMKTLLFVRYPARNPFCESGRTPSSSAHSRNLLSMRSVNIFKRQDSRPTCYAGCSSRTKATEDLRHSDQGRRRLSPSIDTETTCQATITSFSCRSVNPPQALSCIYMAAHHEPGLSITSLPSPHHPTLSALLLPLVSTR